jgi:hypothetical protein
MSEDVAYKLRVVRVFCDVPHTATISDFYEFLYTSGMWFEDGRITVYNHGVGSSMPFKFRRTRDSIFIKLWYGYDTV